MYVILPALAATYESVSATRPRQLFYLLQAIAVIRPEGCKERLLEQLKAHRLDGVTFEGLDLKLLALSARSNYAVHPEDRDFLTFIERSALETPNFDYRLAAFRAQAKHDVHGSFDFFELLLPHLTEERKRKLLGRVLRVVAWAESWRPLYSWFVSDRRVDVERRWPEHFPYLAIAIRDWAIPWRPSEIIADPFGILLAARLVAGEWPFVAEELLFIARTADHWLMRDHFEEVSRTLLTIWDATERHVESWVQPTGWGGVPPPWRLPLGDGRLRTDIKEEVVKHPDREFASQEVDLSGSDLILVALSRGSRAAYVRDFSESSPLRRLESSFLATPEITSVTTGSAW